MALGNCRECEKEVSSKAKTCPNCGVKNPVKKSPIGCAAVGAAVALIIFVGSISDNKGDKRSAPSAPSIPIGQTVAVKSGGIVACLDQGQLKEMQKLAYQKDAEAYKNAVIKGVLGGGCEVLKNGDMVYVDDSDVWSGMIRVRHVGDTEYVWTFTRAIQ